MSFGIVTLFALGAAVYFYKKSSDIAAEYNDSVADSEEYINELLDEIEDLEDKIDPNTNEHSAPLVMTCTVNMGGLTLNQLEIWLNIRNTSESNVEIGDIRSRLFIGNIRSERVIPSNNSRYIIPAGKTVRVRLYARGDVAYPNNYNEVRRLLAPLCGSTGIKIPNNTTILAAELPVKMDLQYLWYWKGGEEECFVYDVIGDFVYHNSVWTVGSYEGYNAGKENQQKANPSYWTKYDVQPIDDGNDE